MPLTLSEIKERHGENWLYDTSKEELVEICKTLELDVQKSDNKTNLVLKILGKAEAAGGTKPVIQQQTGLTDLCRAIAQQTEQIGTLVKITCDNSEKERSTFHGSISDVLTQLKSVDKSKKLTIPHFRNEDDIESYLSRFETLSQTKALSDVEMANELFSHLTGKPLDVGTKLSDTDKRSYKKIKQALLKRYGLTPEEYRKKFRECKLKSDETFEELIQRFSLYLHRWQETEDLKLDDHPQLKKMHNSFLLEQILKIVANEVAVHLKEKHPSTIEEIVEAFENYRLARELNIHKMFKHDSEHKPKHQNPSNNQQFVKQKQKADQSVKPKQHFQPSQNQNQQSKKQQNFKPKLQRDYSKIQCFKCKEFGHTDKICTKKFVPNKEIDEKAKQIRENLSERYKKVEPQHTSSFAFSCSENPTFKDFCYSGFVEDKPTVIFKDTGSSCTLVDQSIVPPQNLTGRFIKIGDVSGNVKSYPEAEVVLQSQNGATLRKVAVMNKSMPNVKVILGRDTFQILKPDQLNLEIDMTITPENIKSVFTETDIEQ